MSETPVRRPAAQEIELAVEAALQQYGGLDTGEFIVQFVIVAETRRMDADSVEHVRRRRWSTVGADMHRSYGLLAAEARRILGKIL